MISIQTSSALLSCSSSYSKRVNAAIHVPKLPRFDFSAPKIRTRKLVEEVKLKDTTPLLNDDVQHSTISNAAVQLYAILEAVGDRVEMHNNMGEQRDNWNTLLLNSINMITLTATTMVGVAAASGVGAAPLLALKLSSALLFSSATGMLLAMNKIQPSQLTEEQRNATRLFRKLQNQIQTTIALGNPTEEDVKGTMEKVLALDKAYPLPLLGAMLEKFPAKFEPAVWWPSTQFQRKNKPQEGKAHNKRMEKMNGWNEELEMELREVIKVIKRKDIEDYDRLGNMALKINKTLAIAGPLLTGIAAAGSAFVGNGSWVSFVPLMAGSMAAAINTFEHAGQVGMIFEMYRNSAGFFHMLETSIESTLEDEDLERRENGELFEMKTALQLGRSVSELRKLASKSSSYRMEGVDIDEFASKLF
ncbi:probable F-box protein At4g22030 [Gastrolobium bilobum]|uniref:probable F-box protein At4g22030 n=1 Tax=Gastrolobium bilobum TaxID=150636 RepID=UPI002AB01554|nr:probable F-box protein At4g22030 [Gastrolobium bilobum]